MIRLIEGLHLTATNRAHMADILGKGWLSGATRSLSYSLEPVEGAPNRFAYTIAKRERDDWNRPVTRQSKGVIEYSPSV